MRKMRVMMKYFTDVLFVFNESMSQAQNEFGIHRD